MASGTGSTAAVGVAADTPLASSLLGPSSNDVAVSSAPLAPYIRILLSSGCSGFVSMPLALQPHMSTDEWKEFWLSLQPVYSKFQWYTNFFNWTAVTFNISMIASIIFAFFYFDKPSLWFIIPWLCVLFFVGIFVSAWQSRACKAQLDDLRSICRDVVEQQNARISSPSAGFTIECECEGVPLSLCLYFFSLSGSVNETALDNKWNDGIRNGYLRIHLSSSSVNGFLWTPLSLSHLESFQTLPVGFETTEKIAELWTRFWAAMMKHSDEYLTAHRRYFTCMCLIVGLYFTCFVVIVTVPSLVDITFNIFLIAQVVCIVLVCRFTALKEQRRHLVSRYTSDFAAEGLHVEYRRLYQFNGFWREMLDAHYIYIFPRWRDAAYQYSGSTNGIV